MIPDGETRAGYVTLAGRPNAGKSTLLNALIGEKLSIVTSKAQTTWQRVTGVDTRDGTQMIFLDTPGLLDPRGLFQRSMLGAALEALREADVVLLVLDVSRPLDDSGRRALARATSESPAPVLAAVNKIDIASPGEVAEQTAWAVESLGARAFPVSARTGEGVGALRPALRESLPVSPFLYPADQIAAAPVRFFVAELVRETVFEKFRQEVPYAVFCQVEEFREDQDPVYIQVNVFVERGSQKRILVGSKGASIKDLGRGARTKIEAFLERPVYLDLWVKVLPGWRRKKSHLRRFGFRTPEENEITIPS
ncbi:MAG TPA: GTPase Era [Longimicrobiales bacterium]|nr:GTPase Era [Longimicrobiales bacterium]